MTDQSIPPSPNAGDYTQDPAYRAQAEANAAPIFDAKDPLELFANWLAQAREKEPNDANAMALATSDSTGLPDVRMVLLKGFDERGFVWYSHKNSAKGRQLDGNPQAALNFHWKSLRRAVRIRGAVEPVAKAEVAAYFSTRARDSRIGAWASKQSAQMKDRSELESMIESIKAKFDGMSVPLPPGWTGWRVQPSRIEFWRDRPFRLHDRLLFTRDGETEPWTKSRLYP